MGLEEVKKDILESAQKEADLTIAKANDKSKEIIELANKKIKELESNYREEIIKMRNNSEIKETASANLEAKRQMLNAKRGLIEMVFNKVFEKIKRLSKAERESALKKLIENASQQITIGKIYCNSRDKPLIDFGAVEEHDSIGGLIAVDTTGTITIDYTSETILNDMRDDHLSQISDILFKNK